MYQRFVVHAWHRSDIGFWRRRWRSKCWSSRRWVGTWRKNRHRLGRLSFLSGYDVLNKQHDCILTFARDRHLVQAVIAAGRRRFISIAEEHYPLKLELAITRSRTDGPELDGPFRGDL